jgi:hypothetical protein
MRLRSRFWLGSSYLELVFLPATTKLRPPQATGGTSHPRYGRNCTDESTSSISESHKILGNAGGWTTTPGG